MVEKSAYLFLGEDSLSKEIKVGVIKKEVLKADASHFDLEILSGKELEPRQLSEAFKRLPAVSNSRLIIIKEIDRLSSLCKEQLISYLKKPFSRIHLVLESDKHEIKDSFILQLSHLCRVVNFQKDRLPDVFGLCQAVVRKNAPAALKILSQLLISGEKPQKIMGVLLWQWKKVQPHLSKKEFRNGLDMLLEADLAIKKGRLKPDFAMELLVAKLSLAS